MKNGYRELLRILRDSRGSTLLECILSLLILTVVMTMAAAMFSTASLISRQTTDLGNSVNNAVDLAETSSSGNKQSGSLESKFPDGNSVSFPIDYQAVEDNEGIVTLWRFT